MSKTQSPEPSETDLPEGWAVANLGDGLIADVQPGFACGTHNREGQGIGHLRPMNVSAEGTIDLSNLKFVPASEADREERLVRAGDVIFNNTNSAELVGKTACYMLPDPLVFSNHMTRLRCRVNAVEPRFCAMQLHQRWREGHFEEVCKHHVSQASVGRKVLLETTFLLPPLAEQKRIVAKVEALLERVNVARTRLARLPAILKRLRQSVLAAACSGRLTETWRLSHMLSESASVVIEQIAASRPARTQAYGSAIAHSENLPDGWVRTTIGFLAEPTLNGRPYVTSGSRGWARYVSDRGPYFIRSENINTDILRIEEAVKVAAPAGAEADRTRVLGGDLLLTITGNNVGRTAVVPMDVPVAHVSQHVAIIRTTRLSDVRYLWLWLRSASHGQGQLEEHFYGETKPGLNLDQVKSVWVALPPVEEQREIVHRVEALFALADKIEACVRAATGRAGRLPQAILARAFRGELVPTEADVAAKEGRDYESVGQMLGRIREETAQQKSQKKARSPMLTRKKAPMKKMDKASVLKAIEAMPTNTFAFDDLRAKLPGDYDAVRDILFKLLDDPESGIVQAFDKEAKAMRFRREGKR